MLCILRWHLVQSSERVGKTDSYCVSKMMGFVVIPAGMCELNVIVTVLGRPTVTV